jgi:nitrite reductase/ring-hydroxylating ferredoxin subunit
MAMARDESVSASLIHRSDLPEVGIVAVDVVIDGENESIIVNCTSAGIVAWFNVCPHQGRRLDYVPGKFLVDEGLLVCAAHGATFRLEDGECIAGPCRGASLRAVPLRISETGELVFAPLPWKSVRA